MTNKKKYLIALCQFIVAIPIAIATKWDYISYLALITPLSGLLMGTFYEKTSRNKLKNSDWIILTSPILFPMVIFLLFPFIILIVLPIFLELINKENN